MQAALWVAMWTMKYDMWCKMHFFGEQMSQQMAGEVVRTRGPKNMLDSLPDTFNEAQLTALRTTLGKSSEGTYNQLHKWMFRNFITYSAQTGLYTKTDEYLSNA